MATGTPQMGAAANANAVEPNLLNMEWRFHEWIIGVGGLNPDNVLDYFAQSPFWDPECNNAVLRMQTQFNNLGEMKQRLSEMTGVEFALVHERYPTLFVIQKQRRRSPQQVTPMAIYYVLQGSIYQCPDLSTLLSNRILGSLHHVESAFNEARVMTEFHPSTGYHWKSSLPEGATATTSSTGADAAASLGSSTPAISIAGPAGSGTNSVQAVSQEFRVAVEYALNTVELRAQQKLQSSQSGMAGGIGGGRGLGNTSLHGIGSDASKIKQEVNSSTAAAAAAAAAAGGNAASSSSSAARNAPKTATKRRKKSEEATAAAASMGINTNVAGSHHPQGRLPSAGGPSTPVATPTKRRKKTKTTDPK
ncbi:Mediator of RNA polymerase II transcription subunit 6 [Mortierella claussenii]|nr:Mediator of RNA polymerase II transcription subunit 6 [Mortierella claussenii]